MSSELIKHVSDSSFESDVIQSDKPVLVDFWAEWCGPCKGIAPILDEASKDYDWRLQIAKLNVDENRDVPAKFGIRIPTPTRCSRAASWPPPRSARCRRHS